MAAELPGPFAEIARLLDSSSDAIMVRDVEDRIVYWNKGAMETYGYTREEALGKSPRELLRTEFSEPLESIRAKLHRDHRWSGELIHWRRDGERVVVIARWVLDRDARGRPGSLLETHTDITERKQAEAAAEREREHLVAALQEERRQLQETQRASAERLHDLEAFHDLAVGREVKMIALEKEVQRLRQRLELLQPVVPDPTGWSGIFQTAGVSLWEEDLSSVKAKLDELRTRDVDDLRRYLAEHPDFVKRAIGMVTTLAELLPQLVWTAGPDGRIDYFNQRWYDYTGQSPDEARGHGWAHSLHPEDRERVWQRWQQALTAREPLEVEYRLRSRDGDYRWFLARGVPVRNAQGAIEKWFGTCTSLEAQKRLEEVLQEADRHKDHFLAILAHELRNPLSVIGNATAILDRIDRQEAGSARARTLIRRQVDHLSNLLTDLSDVAGISRGMIELQRAPLDLRAVADLTVEAHRHAIEAKKQVLHVSLPEHAVVVNADASRVQQVVSDLLDNAAKSTSSGGSIWVSLEMQRDQAVLRVRDSGVGIPSGALASVFEPFTQVNRTSGRPERGLGLSLVKRLVELHDGTVEAHSEGPGTGAEFVVRLPLLQGVRLPEPTGTPARPTSVPPQRIVIIEDNDDAREMLRVALEMAGHRVEEADCGEVGVSKTVEFQPDAVAIDIGLPDLDGFEVARRLRQQLGPTVRLIALTGYGQPEDRRRALEAGFDAHVVKPVDPEQLARILAS